MKIFPQLKMLSTAEDQSLCLHKLCETRRNSPKGDGEINEHAHTHTHTPTHTHTDTHTHTYTHTQTDRQTHRHTDTSSFAASSAALKLPQQAAPCPTLACSFDLLSHSGKSLFGHSCGPSAITTNSIALILASLLQVSLILDWIIQAFTRAVFVTFCRGVNFIQVGLQQFQYKFLQFFARCPTLELFLWHRNKWLAWFWASSVNPGCDLVQLIALFWANWTSVLQSLLIVELLLCATPAHSAHLTFCGGVLFLFQACNYLQRAQILEPHRSFCSGDNTTLVRFAQLAFCGGALLSFNTWWQHRSFCSGDSNTLVLLAQQAFCGGAFQTLAHWQQNRTICSGDYITLVHWTQLAIYGGDNWTIFCLSLGIQHRSFCSGDKNPLVRFAQLAFCGGALQEFLQLATKLVLLQQRFQYTGTPGTSGLLRWGNSAFGTLATTPILLQWGLQHTGALGTTGLLRWGLAPILQNFGHTTPILLQWGFIDTGVPDTTGLLRWGLLELYSDPIASVSPNRERRAGAALYPLHRGT